MTLTRDQPRMLSMLSLYCCEGGDSMGYHRAGFAVTGVDIEPRFAKRYPFRFIAADAVQYIKDHGHKYDAIHASCPCQHASAGTRALRTDGKQYPRLIEPTREALIATGLPYVIENVNGAALRDPLTLCGTMFGLTATDTDGTRLHLRRHRLFESNLLLTPPGPCRHAGVTQWAGSYGGARRDKDEARNERHGGYVPAIPVQRELLGIDWMTQHGMHQSVPPVYTEWLGTQILAHLAAERAA